MSFMIHAHRGIGYGEPENTMAAFQAALKEGHGLEIDPRRTKDGALVIIHDASPERLTGLSGKVSELTIGDLQSRRVLNTSQRIPTFEGLALLLAQYRRRSGMVAIHLKVDEQNEATIRLLAQTIAKYDLYETAFVFDLTRAAVDLLRYVDSRIFPAISIGTEHSSPTIFTEADLPDFADVPILWMDEWKQPGTVYNERLFRRLKADGKKLYAISTDLAKVNGHPQSLPTECHQVWRNLIAWGADGICTDKPLELDAVIRQNQPSL